MNDIWSYAINQGQSQREGEPSRLAGRVLRVKGGYNPNSSSIGSSIPMYLMVAASSGALTVVLLNALGVVGKLLRKQSAADPPKDEPPSADGDEGDDPIERQED